MWKVSGRSRKLDTCTVSTMTVEAELAAMMQSVSFCARGHFDDVKSVMDHVMLEQSQWLSAAC